MRLLLLLFLFTSSFLVYGQEKDVEIVVNLKDDDTGKKLSGATVSVYAEGKLITSSTSSSSGKVPTIYVQTGKYYQIYIRKNGYVTKMAELDARIDLLEDAPDPLFLNFETALFQGVDGVDFSFLESTPMTKFDFDSEYYYRYDKAYTEQMLKKIDELKKQIAEKREEEDKKEKEAKKTEADFLAYVEAGDKAVKDVRYETAIEQYNLALGLRKDDVDVKNKLKEAQRLLDEQKKNEAQEKLYLAKMSEALQAYKGDKLEEAINLYTEASALKREAQEPKDKIDEIRQKIAEQKALEQKIKTLVTSGDMAMAAEGFDEAIEKYTEALGLKDDADIKAKLERAKQKKKAFDEAAEAEKLKIEQYNALMKSAEDLFVKKQLAEAKVKFSEALVLMPEEAIPQRRIEEIDKQLAAQKAAEEKMQAYKEKMQEAETAEGKKEWQAAIEFYKAALAIQPLEQEPQLKIKELTTVLEKEKALKEEYAKFIKEGDQFASTEAYEEAVSKYEKARQIDETDEVTKKIKDALDAMQILAEARNKALKLEAEYKALIEKADKERDSDQITEAVASYSEAQKLKEEETYPTEEIEKLKVLMEQRQAEAEAKAKAEAAYQAIIDAANSAFENKEWEVAKSKYSEAKNLRENDQLPIAKLQEIEKILADLAAAEAKNKAYEAAMTAGREAFEAKSYDEALGQYVKAKGIIENETAPQQKIDEINKILADMKDEAAKEEAYIAAMAKGEELVKGKSYKDAIEAYTSALSFKPGDEKATEEIEKINNMLDEQAKQLAKEAEFKALTEAGDALFADKKYEEAKLKFNSAIAIKSDENVLNKIKLCDEQISLLGAIAAKQDAFNNLLKEADDQFKAENWTEAISKYEAAKAIEANDYIIAQIKAANDKLQDLEDNKALNNKIEGLIASAKEYEAAKNYQKALNTYKEAYLLREMPEIESAIKNVEKEIATIKAEEITNKDYLNKIAEADAALKSKNFATAIDLYRAASSIKETEKYPKDQIAVCESELAKLDEKKNLAEYNEVIAGADQLFSTEKYDQAITQYEKAKLIIPSKTYPDEKIKEIKAIRDKIANAEAERIKQENEYKSLVTLGDNKFDTQNFEDAIATYRSAQKIKAFDPYVEGRIKIAEEKLAEVNAAKATAQKYQSYIDKADALMAKEEWKLAIAEYNTALIYDKSNPYPKSQIALAEKAMETDSQELSETAYQDLLKEAQAKMDAKAYEASLTLYKSAFRQRPTDSRPADKIRELNALIANELAAASAESKYKTLIDKADNLFEKKEWKKARVYYVEAYNLTNDSYPDDQIKKIDAINNKFSSDQYSKMISKADEYFEDENYEKAKGLYTRAIKTFTSQNSSYPKSQIKKINAILNPPALVASGNTKPVGEKVNMTEAEIQKLFAEAEEASKNKQVTNVFNSGQSAQTASLEWQATGTDASFMAVDSLTLQKTLVQKRDEEAEIKRIENEVSSHAIQQNITIQQLSEHEYGENVSYRQMQVVDNISLTNQERTLVMDDGRERFVPQVQEMETEYRQDALKQNGTQSNILFSQVNQIETIEQEQFQAYTNADVARKNAELDVENASVQIVNRANQSIWDQEDQVYTTQNTAERMDTERFEATEQSDVPRQKMENMVAETTADLKNYSERREDQNNDNAYNTNDAVNKLNANMFEANREADAGRTEMETVDSEVARSILVANLKQADKNQTQVQLTNEAITDLKEDQSQSHQNKTDKLYEDTETILENFDDIKSNRLQDEALSENSIHNATSKIKAASITSENNAIKANTAAENSADEISLNQDIVLEEQRQVEKNNDLVLNATEDIIISLRDIDVNNVTQAVKNELGTMYPEGVTEEVYQQKDEDGYLISYVIRRVVVKSGEGNVYEKTQMKHGISYTKNGQAISEYTWQDQTEDASLTYH